MTPVPEPPGDIRAQLAAVLDPTAVKQAAFLTPDDAAHLTIPEGGIEGLIVVRRAEGVLLTVDPMRAEMFKASAGDMTMAAILGYPESKDVTGQRCPKPVSERARAVQARTGTGHVVTEAFCSPVAFLPTVAEMQRHVPVGGKLVVLTPTAAIARRIALRRIGF